MLDFFFNYFCISALFKWFIIFVYTPEDDRIPTVISCSAYWLLNMCTLYSKAHEWEWNGFRKVWTLSNTGWNVFECKSFKCFMISEICSNWLQALARKPNTPKYSTYKKNAYFFSSFYYTFLSFLNHIVYLLIKILFFYWSRAR